MDSRGHWRYALHGACAVATARTRHVLPQELWIIPNGLAALGKGTQVHLKGGGQGTVGKNSHFILWLI